MRLVLDTNVVVSAFITPHGPPARLLTLVLAGEYRTLYDERILSEYREVLLRPRFAFDPGDVAAVLAAVEAGGEPVVAPPMELRLPDPDDLPFAEVAVAGAAEALVTGNRRHFVPTAGTLSVPVLSPVQALERTR